MTQKSLAQKITLNQQRATQILDDAIAQHRRAGENDHELPPKLKRRICQHFALHLKDHEA